MTRLALLSIVFGFILFAHSHSSAADVTLVKDGQAQTAIFVAPEIMADDAANAAQLKGPVREAEQQRQRLRESVKDLAHYLGKISGANVEVVRQAPAAGETRLPILIDELAIKAFGPPAKTAPFKQGFRVLVSPRGVGLEGESPLAASYAIYEVLDRLGCRWFIPSELGEVVPEMKTIALAETDFSSAPATTYRGVWYADDAFRRRNRMGGLPLSAGHALEMYFSKEDRQQHPEWMAEIGGKPHPHRLRWSNAALADALADKLLALYAADPAPSYSLSPDDGIDFDESAEDRAIDAHDYDVTLQTQSITDRLLVLANRVAERASAKQPEVLFGLLAYAQYTRPPMREKVHPNIVPQIAPITYSRAHPMTDDAVPSNKDLRYLIEGWGKAARQTSVYFYGFYLAETSAPNPMLTKWGVDVPIVLANNCRFWQPETMPNFETSMHAIYLGNRLAWDRGQQPQAIIDEFNHKFYGRAGREMAAYWKQIDDAWVQTPEYSGCGFNYLRRFTPERMAAARQTLNQALAASQTPNERARVKLADDSFALFELFIKLRHDQAEGRFETLADDAAQWRKRIVALGEQYKDQFCFTRVPWTPHTVGGAYFSQFYQQTYDDATRVAKSFDILTRPPLVKFRYLADEKLAGEAQGYARPDFDDSKWKTTDVCHETWSTLGYHDYHQSMWYRATADVRHVPGKKTYLWIGSTDGSAKVFVNGKHVPHVDAQGKQLAEINGYCQPFSFDITATVEKSGPQQIAILCKRTFLNELGTGGLLAPVIVYGER